ncbi:MAG: polymer-forming cytoskeletal protein, partial [Rhodospirillaceae bacterium]|nr:polymer-forming cytoskeletal protein [Rhodospirillaceae bacterium]
MFSKSKKGNSQNNADGTPVVKPSVPSIMSADLVVTGDIVSEGEVQIDGEVIGDIKSNVLLVGTSAKITGEIFANTIRIHGSVYGTIKAKTVHLAKTAHVVGDVLHENLSIDEGAFIEGHITRMNEPAPAVSDERVNLVVNKTGQPSAQSAAQASAQVKATAPTAQATTAANAGAVKP